MLVKVLRNCFVEGHYFGKGTSADVADAWIEKYPKNFVHVDSVKPKQQEPGMTYKGIADTQPTFTSDQQVKTDDIPTAEDFEEDVIPAEDEAKTDTDDVPVYVSDKPKKEKIKKHRKAKAK